MIFKCFKYPNVFIRRSSHAGFPRDPVLRVLEPLDILAEQNKNGIGTSDVGSNLCRCPTSVKNGFDLLILRFDFGGSKCLVDEILERRVLGAVRENLCHSYQSSNITTKGS